MGSSNNNKECEDSPNEKLQELEEKVNLLIEMKFTKIEGGKSNLKRWSLGEEFIKD